MKGLLLALSLLFAGEIPTQTHTHTLFPACYIRNLRFTIPLLYIRLYNIADVHLLYISQIYNTTTSTLIYTTRHTPWASARGGWLLFWPPMRSSIISYSLAMRHTIASHTGSCLARVQILYIVCCIRYSARPPAHTRMKLIAAGQLCQSSSSISSRRARESHQALIPSYIL